MTSLAADPAVRAIAQALYGDAVTVEEFAKSLDAADVHVDRAEIRVPARRRRRRRPVRKDASDDQQQDGPPSKRKAALAGGLLAGAGIEALAATHTLKPLQAGIAAVKPAVADAGTLAGKAKAAKPLVAGPAKKVVTGEAAPLTNTALQAGNFGVGLGAANELVRGKKKKDQVSMRYEPVGKGLRVALRPVNAQALRRVPSLRARRPAGSPAVAKGIIRNAKTVTANAAQASESGAKIARKVERLIPGRAAAAAIGVGGVGALGAANGGATYLGAKHGTAAALNSKPKKPKKQIAAEGQITKIDTDRREVFGWANVSVKDGQTVLDRQGDEFPIDELEKAAYDYMLDSRIGGDQHARLGKGVTTDFGPKHTADIIESMVFTPEKIEKMGLPSDFPQGWWVGMKVHDEPTWQLIKSGKRTGFSVHGAGRRVQLEKADRQARRARAGLRERGRQAAHPPAVRRKATPESSAIASLGYQKQTRKLDVEMRSRLGEPYSYRVAPKTARKVTDASSKGRAYTSEIRNKTPHHTRYTAGDRARLFVHPERDS